MSIDRKSLKLLRALQKRGYLPRKEMADLIGDGKLDEHLRLLKARHFADGKPGQDGYSITLEGVAFLEERRRQFWSFLVPYSITTLIAAAALLSQILHG